MINKYKKMVLLLKEPKARFCYLNEKGFYSKMDDEKFLKKAYRIFTNKKLDLEHPVSYTEKLQWLKLYDRKEIYSQMVDKYNVKKLVQEKIGQEYVIPTLGVFDTVEEIDFEILPNQFILKCTHDSGGTIICQNKQEFDIQKAKEKLNYFLKRDYYSIWREWPYKNVRPRIIAEQYMEDHRDKELRDYKFFTFGGEPRLLYITQGRGGRQETTADFFDVEGRHLEIKIDHEMATYPPHLPGKLELMKQLATILAEGTPQLRVDFYEVDGKVYFGEMTFFHCSGWEEVKPKEWNKLLGDWVQLPKHKE